MIILTASETSCLSKTGHAQWEAHGQNWVRSSHLSDANDYDRFLTCCKAAFGPQCALVTERGTTDRQVRVWIPRGVLRTATSFSEQAVQSVRSADDSQDLRKLLDIKPHQLKVFLHVIKTEEPTLNLEQMLNDVTPPNPLRELIDEIFPKLDGNTNVGSIKDLGNGLFSVSVTAGEQIDTEPVFSGITLLSIDQIGQLLLARNQMLEGKTFSQTENPDPKSIQPLWTRFLVRFLPKEVFA